MSTHIDQCCYPRCRDQRLIAGIYCARHDSVLRPMDKMCGDIGVRLLSLKDRMKGGRGPVPAILKKEFKHLAKHQAPLLGPCAAERRRLYKAALQAMLREDTQRLHANRRADRTLDQIYTELKQETPESGERFLDL